MNSVTPDEQAAADEGALALVKGIMQLAYLQQRVAPLIPAASQKLVSDLLGSGMTDKQIGKIVNRAPSYVRAIAGGSKSLTAISFTRLVHHATKARPQNDSE